MVCALSRRLLRGAWNISHFSRCPGRGPSPEPNEYKSELLCLKQTSSSAQCKCIFTLVIISHFMGFLIIPLLLQRCRFVFSLNVELSYPFSYHATLMSQCNCLFLLTDMKINFIQFVSPYRIDIRTKVCVFLLYVDEFKY